MIWALALSWAGSVQGVVVDPAGDPVSGVLVVAYDRRLNYQTDSTNSSGGFSIGNLSKGDYRLRFLPPSSHNGIEFYFPGVPSLCDAEPQRVKRADALILGEVGMPEGGIIEGVLGDVRAVGSGVRVTAEPLLEGASPVERNDRTDANGRFQILGIPVQWTGADYRLKVEPETGFAEQFIGPAYEADLAATVTVDEGEAVQLGYERLVAGGRVEGVLRGSGAPLPGESVYATDVAGTRSSVTDEAGRFTIDGLVPGDITLWAEAEGHALGWYPDGTLDAGLLPVAEGEPTGPVVLELPAEGRIRGALPPESAGTETTVAAFNLERTVARYAPVDEDGSFELTKIPEGEWTLELLPDEALGWVDGPLQDSGRAPIQPTVVSGQTVELGQLAPRMGARFHGVVRDAADGSPVYGAWVYVDDQSRGVTRLVATESDGHWEMGGLAEGNYRIWADYQRYCDGDPDWVAQYYPAQVNAALVGTIRLSEGQSFEWNPSLGPDVDYDLMGDVWEASQGLDVGRDDSAEDRDGDGFTNLEEYLLGTNPNQAPAECACGGGPPVPWLALSLASWAAARRRRRDGT